ncbi:L-threonine 3-dehydrogenase [subsurface metagenome]
MKIPKTMPAAVLMGPEELQVKEVNTPVPGPEDVLIQVKACSICSSDVSLIKAPWPGQPDYGTFIPGHEYSGIVAAVGKTVCELQIGDRVAVEAHFGCTRCPNCRIGNYTACLNWGLENMGHRANGFTTNGGFAEYVVNHVSTTYKIPQWVSYEEASLITNLGCVLYGFETIGGFVVGNHIAVIGEGPLGLISLQVARLLEADMVYLLGIDKYRLKIGSQLGADRIINVLEEDPLPLLKKEMNSGVDLTIEASGSDEGLKIAMRLPKWMGKVLLLGIPDSEVRVDLKELARGNKTIFTVRGEGRTNCGRGVSLLRRRRIDLGSLVTHIFPLEKIDKAFKTHTDKNIDSIKVVVQPS